MKCQLHKSLYNFLPFKKMKALIIQKHFKKCEQCRNELPSDSELNILFPLPSWILEEKDMWPEIKSMLNSDLKIQPIKSKKMNLFSSAWGWAAAVLFICIAAVILYFSGLNAPRETISPTADSSGAMVKVKYGEIKGEKARYHIYQAEDKYYILFLKPQNSGG